MEKITKNKKRKYTPRKPNSKKISDIEVAKKMINIHQSAADRKLEFNLSFEYVKRLLEHKSCYYTKKIFTEEGPEARSFDRIDSDLGYIEGNVVSCTVDINGKKSNLSYEEIECIYKKLEEAKNREPEVIDESHALDLVMNDMVKDFTEDDIREIVEANESPAEPNTKIKEVAKSYKDTKK